MIFIRQLELFSTWMIQPCFFMPTITESITTLEQRVGFLERCCRHLAGLLIAAMAVMIVIFFGGAAPNVEPANLQVRKLEVMDEGGNVRIRLGKADEG